MADNVSFGRSVRLRRLFRGGGQRLFVVPLDHAVTDGPAVRGGHLRGLVSQVCANGADAVVLHKGGLRHVPSHWFTDTSLIVHLSAGTGLAADPDARYLVASVAEALRAGADCVSVHVNLGSDQEAQQIRDLASVAAACDRWNLPLLAMVYPRGPRIHDPRDPDLVAHAATLAAELGADIVKTVCPAKVEALEEITRTCPIPVLIAGGPTQGDTDDLVTRVRGAMRAGAAGVAIGRNIFQSARPGAMTRLLADAVHGHDRLAAGRELVGVGR
jgi:2-amino-4,5-dihydroxy-6-oxo-7-(phosphooxy)heptanoate synthase